MIKTFANVLSQARKWLNPSFAKAAYRSFTRRERGIFLAASGTLAASLFAILIGAYYATTALVAVPGGELIEGVVGQPIIINPILNQNSNDVDRDIAELVYGGLLRSNGRGGVVPDLAERVVPSDDGLTWTAYLNAAATWHDGDPFDADDVIFTVEAVQDPATGSHLFTRWQGVVVERVSALEVKFVLRSPYASFEENLKELKILPSHIFGAVPRTNFHLSGYNLEPVGTGPFKFASMTRRKDGFVTEYALVKNEAYQRGPVYIDSLRLKFFQNEEEVITAFNRREIDAFGNAKPETLARIQVPSRLLSFHLPRYFAVFFNQNIEPALKDGAVRRALDLSADKQSILKFVFAGHGAPISGPVVPGMLGYRTDDEAGAFDPAAAQMLLDAAGWKLSSTTDDNVQVRTKGGEALELSLVTPDTEPLTKVAELLKNDWEKIGARITIVPAPISEIADEHVRGRTYEMLLFGNIVNFNTDLFAFWHSSQKFHPGLNLSLFDSKEADRLIETARQSVDREARIANIAQLQTVIAESTPAAFLFSPDYLYITNNKLNNVETTFILTPAERFSQIERWSIKQARVFQ